MTTEKAAGASRQAIDRFFDRELMALARELRGQGVELLASALQPQKSSYYSQRTVTAMAPASFEWGGAESDAQLQAALAAMWRGSDCPRLEALAPSVARLAAGLRSTEEQAAEVSQFVYVMY